jgi:menaquinone-9 beta-reductase
MKKYDAAVIGGGPAGSYTAFLLASEGLSVCLFERKQFPREILCGEFLSYEVSNHLKAAGLFEEFLSLKPNKITSFRLHSSEGNSIAADFKFTAFGLKRSLFDEFLLRKAVLKGADVYQPYNVNSVKKEGESFFITAAGTEQLVIESRRVIGAFGKRSTIDKQIGRDFTKETTPYNGVKIHLNKELFRNFPANEIHIYTGNDLYCGLNQVNDSDITACFLEKRKANDPPVREKFLSLKQENLFFRNIILDAAEEEIQRTKVYGTGNIYFGRKKIIDEEIYMTGDAAGIIAPLAGDGIGMAIESARLVSDAVLLDIAGNDGLGRKTYADQWERKFRRRILTAGNYSEIYV